ncbi:MAG TPA: uroporphyrinogen decarboxylase family protein [Chloroflexota bacterium]|nr:uroporphyrinogen decarboxylase family protein [Chloroflexota bacterium]
MPATMTKRERVLAAIAGQDVDRVPVSFWVHNFARENSAQDLADETAQFVNTYDWDFVKVQSRASYFAEGWGNQYQWSSQPTVGPTLVSRACATVADLAHLKPLSVDHPVFAEQQDALRLVRAALGPDAPIIWTIFCPLTIAASLVPGGPGAIQAAMRSDPSALLAGLGTIAATYAALSQRYLELGADGIFYASKWIGPRMLSRDEHARFARPFDLRILDVTRSAPCNILHLCGEEVYFADFHDYPAAMLNWAVEENNPSVAEVRQLTDRALLGGVSAKPGFAALTPAQVAAQVQAAVEATSGRHLLIGPGCSVNPGSPPANYLAAQNAARGE